MSGLGMVAAVSVIGPGRGWEWSSSLSEAWDVVVIKLQLRLRLEGPLSEAELGNFIASQASRSNGIAQRALSP